MPFRTDAVPAEVIDLLIRTAPLLNGIPDTYLAGGTALSLHLGHRISVDLDFFSPSGFSADQINEEMKNLGEYSPVRIAENTILCRIDQVLFSLFKYPYPLLAPPEPFSGAAVASLRDIAAMKVVAIGHRGSRKDFYDLYALLNLASLTIEKILEDTKIKYGLPQDNLYHYVRSLGFFDDAQGEPDIQHLVRMKASWNDVEDFFAGVIRRLLP